VDVLTEVVSVLERPHVTSLTEVVAASMMPMFHGEITLEAITMLISDPSILITAVVMIGSIQILKDLEKSIHLVKATHVM
jgi:hypothetical protein